MKSKAETPSEGSLEQFERLHVKPAEGRTLIVGSRVYEGREDRRLRYADALGVDMLEGSGVDLVMDLETGTIGEFDHIECMSVLEHTRRPWKLAENLESMLRPGGTIFVSAPFVWRIHAYPHDHWRFTPDGIRQLFPRIQWDAVMLASETLREGPKIAAIKESGYPYLARTDTVAFGRR